MRKIKQLYLIIGAITLLFVFSGCVNNTGFKKVDLDPDLFDPQTNDDDSAVHDLTPIVIIGDDVSVAVYKCSTDTDCNRCQEGDVYGQTCIGGTCQGSLDIIEDCKEECSVGECIEKDVFTGEEDNNLIGEELDLDFTDDDAIVDNDDLLPDLTQCSNKIKDCVGYRGIGSIYLSDHPACECKYIYVPAGCSPLQAPCPDFSARSNYPECACE